MDDYLFTYTLASGDYKNNSGFLYNTEITDCIYYTYMDILKAMLEKDVSDEKINEIAKRYHARLSKFNEKEQEYIKFQIKKVLLPNMNEDIKRRI